MALTEAQEERRQELIRIKKEYGLTNGAIAGILPEGVGTLRTVNNWMCGSRSIPIPTLIILRHLMEKQPIVGKQTVAERLRRAYGLTPKEVRNYEDLKMVFHGYCMGERTKEEVAAAVALYQRQTKGEIA